MVEVYSSVVWANRSHFRIIRARESIRISLESDVPYALGTTLLSGITKGHFVTQYDILLILSDFYL
jgi:hypothetical protein